MLMNHATPIMRKFAECLIARENDAEWPAFKFPLTENQATLGIVEKLRVHVEELMGEMGFRALLMNALACAKEEAPWLGETQFYPDGSFKGFEKTLALRGSGMLSTGGSVMLAWFLGLLTSSIGELLTIQLVLEVWPDLSATGSRPEEPVLWGLNTVAVQPQRFAQYHEN